MRICEWCEIKEVKVEVSYMDIHENFISCCDDCFEDHYEGDEDLKTVVVLKD
jgi:hypothetical protein